MPKEIKKTKRTGSYEQMKKEGLEDQQERDRQLVLAIKYMVEKYKHRMPANIQNADLILQYQEISKNSDVILDLELINDSSENKKDQKNKDKNINAPKEEPKITINPDGSKEYRGFMVMDKEDFMEFEDEKKSQVKKDTEKKEQTKDKPQVKMSI